MSAPIVHAPCGPVVGVERPGSLAFLGIPYAEAPIGDLRFGAPVRRAPWTEPRDCTQFGATPQRKSPFLVATIPEPVVPGVDILNLNVFTPSLDVPDAMPVHVYIHGGGYIGGSHVGAWFDGATYNVDGIVVVTISYRLGFDGFGWIADAPRNRGLRDMVCALEWVRDNIGAFGGDPSRVTISGQSAGGGAVLTLLATPAARGLFSGVIAHSPVIGASSAAQHEAKGRAFAADAGVEPTRAGWGALDELQILELQLAQMFAASGPHPMAKNIAESVHAICDVTMQWAPAIDPETLPEVPLEAWMGGYSNDVALMLGATTDEFLMPPQITPPADVARAWIASADLPTPLREYALAIDPAVDPDILGRLATTIMFRRNVLDVAAARTRGGGRVWLYDFAHRSSVTGTAGHCLDLPFTWNCLGAQGASEVLGANQPQELADAMHGAWVSFMKQRDPGWAEAGMAGFGAVFGADAGQTAYQDVRALVAAAPKVR